MSAVAAGGLRRVARASVVLAAVVASTGISGVLLGHAASRVAGQRMAPWIIGRAAGVCSYLLLVGLVLMGLVLSHPWRTRVRYPNQASRIRLHVALAAFTLAFIVLHVVVLATDRYAGVGWWGALLPMRASYRPVATTLGLIGAWSGLLAGVTASFAGRLPRWTWWPLHKVAVVAFALVWLHGVLGGGDTPALLAGYFSTAAVVLAVAVSRYTARTPADLVAELRR